MDIARWVDTGVHPREVIPPMIIAEANLAFANAKTKFKEDQDLSLPEELMMPMLDQVVLEFGDLDNMTSIVYEPMFERVEVCVTKRFRCHLRDFVPRTVILGVAPEPIRPFVRPTGKPWAAVYGAKNRKELKEKVKGALSRFMVEDGVCPGDVDFDGGSDLEIQQIWEKKPKVSKKKKKVSVKDEHCSTRSPILSAMMTCSVAPIPSPPSPSICTLPVEEEELDDADLEILIE